MLKSKLRDFLTFKLKIESEDEQRKLLCELTTSSQQHYENNIASVNRAKQYMAWIREVSGDTDFESDYLEKSNSYLDIKSKISKEKAQLSSQAEKALKIALEQKLQQSQLNKLMAKFIESIHNQLVIKKQIYEREVNVSNIFLQLTSAFLRNNMINVKEKNPQSLIGVAKILKVLSKKTVKGEELINLNVKDLLIQLNVFQENLQERESALERLKSIITQLGSILNQISTSNQEEIQPNTVSKKHLSETSKPSNRMAIKTSKVKQ